MSSSEDEHEDLGGPAEPEGEVGEKEEGVLSFTELVRVLLV